MPKLYEEGRVYLALPPLYKVRKGDKHWYAADDDALEKLLKQTGDNVIITRFKGLGEMNADDLSATTLNRETRTLKRLVVEDFDSAADTFELLMGKNVAPRKEWIMENAQFAHLLID